MLNGPKGYGVHVGVLHKAIGDGVVAGPGSTVCAEWYQNPVSKGGGFYRLPVVTFVCTNRRARSAWPPVDFVGEPWPMRGSSKGPRPRGDHLDDGAFCMLNGPKGYDVPVTQMRVMQRCRVMQMRVRAVVSVRIEGRLLGSTKPPCTDTVVLHRRSVFPRTMRPGGGAHSAGMGEPPVARRTPGADAGRMSTAAREERLAVHREVPACRRPPCS